MTLQRGVKRDQWIDYPVDGRTVKSPVDIDALLIMMWHACECGVLSGKQVWILTVMFFRMDLDWLV